MEKKVQNLFNIIIAWNNTSYTKLKKERLVLLAVF